MPLAGIDLELLLSIRHERVVRNDNTVTFNNVILQLPTTRQRLHFVRCPVLVHQFPDQTLGVSYQSRLLARYDRSGGALPTAPSRERAATAHRSAGQSNAGRRGAMQVTRQAPADQVERAL